MNVTVRICQTHMKLSVSSARCSVIDFCNTDNKPWAGLISRQAYFWRGLLLEGVLRLKMVGLDFKKQ